MRKKEFYELPLYKQEELIEKSQHDLEVMKSLLRELKDEKNLSPSKKSQLETFMAKLDYDELIECVDFTMHANSNLLLYYQSLQAEGKHPSQEEQSQTLN